MGLNTIKNFSDDINGLNLSLVGGKAFSLVDLYQRDFLVPNGFIITTQAFDCFLRSLSGKNNKDILSQIYKEGDYFKIHAADIREKIIASELPPELAEAIYDSFISLNTLFVAVRSSATVEDGRSYSYAGQFESFLGVNKENLLSKVKLCWASLFGQRALAYSRIGNKIGKMAVIVQQMVKADTSGVCFSVNPVIADKNTLIIESVLGVAEPLVQGAVVPERYTVCKDTLIIKEKHVNMHELIDDNAVKEIARLAIKIEKLYNKPVDIEWAMKDSRFYLLQARPITTL